MSNKYKPIDAPITPERQAAMQFMRQCEQPKPSVAKSTKVDYESYRDAFEQWVLGNFYCPKGLGQFRKHPDRSYMYVAYDKNDSLRFTPIESMWKSFILGLQTKLS